MQSCWRPLISDIFPSSIEKQYASAPTSVLPDIWQIATYKTQEICSLGVANILTDSNGITTELSPHFWWRKKIGIYPIIGFSGSFTALQSLSGSDLLGFDFEGQNKDIDYWRIQSGSPFVTDTDFPYKNDPFIPYSPKDYFHGGPLAILDWNGRYWEGASTYWPGQQNNGTYYLKLFWHKFPLYGTIPGGIGNVTDQYKDMPSGYSAAMPTKFSKNEYHQNHRNLFKFSLRVSPTEDFSKFYQFIDSTPGPENGTTDWYKDREEIDDWNVTKEDGTLNRHSSTRPKEYTPRILYGDPIGYYSKNKTYSLKVKINTPPSDTFKIRLNWGFWFRNSEPRHDSQTGIIPPSPFGTYDNTYKWVEVDKSDWSPDFKLCENSNYLAKIIEEWAVTLPIPHIDSTIGLKYDCAITDKQSLTYPDLKRPIDNDGNKKSLFHISLGRTLTSVTFDAGHVALPFGFTLHKINGIGILLTHYRLEIEGANAQPLSTIVDSFPINTPESQYPPNFYNYINGFQTYVKSDIYTFEKWKDRQQIIAHQTRLTHYTGYEAYYDHSSYSPISYIQQARTGENDSQFGTIPARNRITFGPASPNQYGSITQSVVDISGSSHVTWQFGPSNLFVKLGSNGTAGTGGFSPSVIVDGDIEGYISPNGIVNNSHQIDWDDSNTWAYTLQDCSVFEPAADFEDGPATHSGLYNQLPRFLSKVWPRRYKLNMPTGISGEAYKYTVTDQYSRPQTIWSKYNTATAFIAALAAQNPGYTYISGPDSVVHPPDISGTWDVVSNTTPSSDTIMKHYWGGDKTDPMLYTTIQMTTLMNVSPFNVELIMSTQGRMTKNTLISKPGRVLGDFSTYYATEQEMSIFPNTMVLHTMVVRFGGPNDDYTHALFAAYGCDINIFDPFGSNYFQLVGFQNNFPITLPVGTVGPVYYPDCPSTIPVNKLPQGFPYGVNSGPANNSILHPGMFPVGYNFDYYAWEQQI